MKISGLVLMAGSRDPVAAAKVTLLIKGVRRDSAPTNTEGEFSVNLGEASAKEGLKCVIEKKGLEEREVNIPSGGKDVNLGEILLQSSKKRVFFQVKNENDAPLEDVKINCFQSNHKIGEGFSGRQGIAIITLQGMSPERKFQYTAQLEGFEICQGEFDLSHETDFEIQMKGISPANQSVIQPPPQTTDEQSEIATPQLGSCIVFIESDDYIGTGFIVREDGLVLTEANNVSGSKFVSITLREGTTLEGKVLASDENHGFGIIEIVNWDNGNKISIPEIGNGLEIPIGDEVLVNGYARSSAEYSIVSNIVISKTRGTNGLPYLVISSSSQTSMFGAPVFSRKGCLVGMIVNVEESSSDDSLISTALPGEYIREAVDQIPSLSELTDTQYCTMCGQPSSDSQYCTNCGSPFE